MFRITSYNVCDTKLLRYMGIERSTLLRDKNGELVKEWRKVKVADHVEEVLEYIKNNLG